MTEVVDDAVRGRRAADPVARVRKLLAKAERAGTEAEARTYNAKAAELIARHGIDAALLAAASPGSDPVGGTRVALADPYSAAKARLLGWTASALRCRWVLHRAARGRVAAVTVFGHASDRERVALLFESLLLQATRELVRCRPPDARESVAAYRRSWLLGFAAQVHERLTAAEQAAACIPGGGAALVLADRSVAVEQAFAAAYPHLVTARRSVHSGSGFGAGALAASAADLGGPRLAAGAS
ncbi:hypothetical protein PSU4_54510 [Pseudonocardia sulfidoxydans NBRC 16205]|uniref:Uncharacterized protein n=1 Tax=Pseudonocardia sulfidoxydans NBRC 16205 TaxID=1223511 RepID=A0A511DQ68_9PSEU|nr:DUF2786 domain-containing protein [Pseudonocardia sulfidoxydans]GEL26497.1 hypothetical protein PSU4_54510 [Pseudonocardia sulfidoxydans NBRC 16205]